MSGNFAPFNPAAYDPSQSQYSSVPDGRYKLMLSTCEVKANASQTGGGIYFDIRIIDGPEQGKVILDVVNLWNPDAKAVEIAQRRLSAYCHVMGRGNQVLNHPSELLNIPFQGDIKNNTGKDKMNPQTGVMEKGKTFTNLDKLFDVNGNAPSRIQGAPGQAQQPQQAPPPPPPQQPPQQAPAQGWAQPPQPQQPPAQPAQAPAQTWAQPPAQAPQQPQQPQPPGGWGPPPSAAPAPAQAPAGWGPPQG